MPPYAWPSDPVLSAANLDGRTAGGSALAWHAAECVNALHYLGDLDQLALTANYCGHNEYNADLSNVRWACGTAMAGIDLCGAVVGRIYNLRRNAHFDSDLGDLVKEPRNRRRFVAAVPTQVAWWAMTAAWNDPAYEELPKARHKLTHSWVGRQFAPSQRIGVLVDGGYTAARDVIESARDVATTYVTAFLGLVDNGVV